MKQSFRESFVAILQEKYICFKKNIQINWIAIKVLKKMMSVSYNE